MKPRVGSEYPVREMPEVLPLELQSLLAHWVVLCAGRKMPDRRDMPLRALERWFDHTAIVDPVPYGDLRRYCFAFCGQKLVGRFGCDAMRMELRELDRPIWTDLLNIFEQASQAPATARFRFAKASGSIVTYHDLVLPLSDGRDRASQLLMASYPLD